MTQPILALREGETAGPFSILIPEHLGLYLAWLDSLPAWKRWVVQRPVLWRRYVDDFRSFADRNAR